MKTSNPALNEKAFKIAVLPGTETMTIQGTVNKTAISLLLLFMSAAWTWGTALGGGNVNGLLTLGCVGGFVVCLITIFKKEWAPVTTPVYCLLEGMAMGGLSAAFEYRFPGLVIQAVMLTFGTLFALLVAYRAGVRPSENVKLGIFAATGGIGLVYLADILFSLFGHRVPFLYQSGFIGIGFSLFVVIIAALNLVLDFDFIEKGASQKAPKYMEWYGAFSLMVTLIWLYLEILRLLAKLQNRK